MRDGCAKELAQEIDGLFGVLDEVVLGTQDIREFLGDEQPVDSVTALQVVRTLADENDWEAFVYDYGAWVCFKRRNVPDANRRRVFRNCGRRKRS